MSTQPVTPITPNAPAPIDRRAAIAGAFVLGGLALLGVAVIGLVMAFGAGAPAAPVKDPAQFAYAQPGEAPALELTDQAGQPFQLTSLRGHPVLVFFGYTHCPDVCPATIGTLNQVIADAGDDVRAVFTSIDPERDGPAEMATYVKYLPKVYTGLSGTPDEIATNANRWGVKYAKVEENNPNGYAMSHTADVFLVDQAGRLVAHFPFGTEAAPITAAVKALLAGNPVAEIATGAAPPAGPSAAPVAAPSAVAPSTAPAATPLAPTPAPSSGEGTDLRVLLVSSSIWAGPQTPVIVTLSEMDGTPLDGSVNVDARVIGANETPTGPDVPAVAILPTGAKRASFVATVQIPVAGWWRLDLVTADGRKGSVAIQALDPGTSAPIGQAAPAIHTPTLDDVGGKLLAVTTQEAPDVRFYQQSTSDARAARRPYVLIVDSSRFRVSPACGRALTMARYLLDRWQEQVTFVHLEPFKYQVITEAPVLQGDIADPPLNDQSKALGLGDSVWPATEMPWIFIVDGQGIVRAKYTGIVGSADVDLILSLIEGQGVIAR